MVVFALFGLQVYLGVLRQKCVKDPIYPISHGDYDLHIKNSSNWQIDQQGQYFICGNISSAGACPSNYTCLPDIGENPNWGYTNFDHFGWSMLNSLQLITLDFWEDPYNKVIHANGPWNIVFFIFVVFFGSFYLVNLMLAVVSMAYEEEAKNAGKRPGVFSQEKERESEKEKSKISTADETVGESAQKNDEESEEKDQIKNTTEKDQPTPNSKPEDDDTHTEKSAKDKRKERMKNQGTMDSGMGSDDKLDKADNNDSKFNKTDGEKKKSHTQKIPKVKIRGL
ncbi:DgyrCDS12358 [Dimorphilus gyrociliatus]|uniref:DgyrCDS12358 n=1 Tax=Dimorphilus gyrociliatus TaxID=2664684 RepID=A0A7I8W8J6_9ANNE|nr:DgyrCDS12358 [Dimorphilus gyrociliatus]